jgi:hypothetical protein
MPLVPQASRGPARVVQPDVAALDQIAADLHVVIFQKDHGGAAFRGLAEAYELLDDLFAFVVPGVGLAGEDELHRRAGSVTRRFRRSSSFKSR